MRTIHSPRQSPIDGRVGRSIYAVPDRGVPRAAYVPAGRTLHLIDVENLMGGPDRGTVALHRALADYRLSAPVSQVDHAVIGTNPALGVIAKQAWPEARLVTHPGPDGADIALLETVRDVQFIASRYDQVVIGSGDGVFEAVVREYRRLGIPVGVVAPERGLSESLRYSASFVRLMELTELNVAL